MGVDNAVHEGGTSEWLMMKYATAHYLQSRVKYIFIMQEKSAHFYGFCSTYIIFGYEILVAFIQTIQLYKYTNLRKICSYCWDNLWCDTDPHARLFYTYCIIAYHYISTSFRAWCCKVKKHITDYYMYFIN